MKTTTSNTVREKILRAAVRLLGDCGIRKLMQPQIAKKAGVPQGHMTYYFPTREDLLLAVAERSIETIVAQVMKSLADRKNSASEDMCSLLAPILKDEQRTRMMIGLLVESDENKKLRTQLHKHSETAHQLIGMSVNKEPTSDEVWFLHAALLGIGLLYYSNPSPEAESKVDQSLDLLKQKFFPAETL